MPHKRTLIFLTKQSKLTSEFITRTFLKEHKINTAVNKISIRDNNGFEVYADSFIYFLSEFPISYKNKNNATVTLIQERLLKISTTPLPLYIGEGELSNEIHRISHSENPSNESDKWLLDIFSPRVTAIYFNKHISNSTSLIEYKPIILEAIESFCLGMNSIAIMSLLPVFEAGLRNIQNKINGESNQSISLKDLDHGINKTISNIGAQDYKKYHWHQGMTEHLEDKINFYKHSNNQCDVICSLKLFLKDLYSQSNKIKSKSSFNRNIIIHMFNSQFNNPANFIRIFIALTHILFIESLHNNKIPFFFPYPDEKDCNLALHFKKLQNEKYLLRYKN